MDPREQRESKVQWVLEETMVNKARRGPAGPEEESDPWVCRVQRASQATPESSERPEVPEPPDREERTVKTERPEPPEPPDLWV